MSTCWVFLVFSALGPVHGHVPYGRFHVPTPMAASGRFPGKWGLQTYLDDRETLYVCLVLGLIGLIVACYGGL